MEALGGTASDRLTPIAWRGAARLDVVVPVTWSGTASFITTDAKTPLSWSSVSRRDQGLATYWRSTVLRDCVVPVGWGVNPFTPDPDRTIYGAPMNRAIYGAGGVRIIISGGTACKE
jgi:hypothetical protein